MDTARQCIPNTPARIVTAEDVLRDLQGDVPASVRFRCPSCDRPVRFNRGNKAYDSDTDIARRHTRTVSPTRASRSSHRSLSAHFKHAKNDPISKLCDRYQSGQGADPRTDPPALPMFLRRNHRASHSGSPTSPTTTFHIELSARRRSLGHDLIPELLKDHAELIVDATPFPLADLVADRRYKIRLENPTFHMGARITVPERWQRNVGVPKDGDNAFLFTAEFGPNGGRRLTYGSSLHAGFDYYAVVRPRELRLVRSCFDIAQSIGTVPSSHGDFLVASIVVQWDSRNREQAECWLADHGFRLTNLDFDPVPVWPPQLRGDGIDEPLFANSFQIYEAPFPSCDDAAIPDDITFPNIRFDMSEPRRAGLLGFTQNGRTYTHIEGTCCFLRASRHLPWSAYVCSRTHPEALELAAPPEPRPLEHEPRTEQSSPPLAPSLHEAQWQAANRHYDIVRARTGAPMRYGTPPSVSIAGIRSAHR